MVQQSTRLTAEDLLCLPDDEQRSELVRGELRQMAPAGGEHGGLALSLGSLIHTFARQTRLGRAVGAETGFILRRDPDTVRAPDVAFIHRDRLTNDILPIGYLPFPPDLAVEIISPSESAEEVQEKVMDYLNAGVLLIWLIYPRTRVIAVHSKGATRTLAHDDILDGGDVLPGFQVPVADIFAR